MTHDAYSTKRVTVWRELRNGEDGFAVKYQDGYSSWCPKAVYERDYQPITAMGFSGALHALKAGKKVARAGWKNQIVALRLLTDCEGKRSFALVPRHADEHDTVRTFDWIPTLDVDLLADDWFVVGEV